MRHLGQTEARKVSSSNQQNLEVLLASLADLRLTLNESGGVQAVDANSGLLRHLPRDAMIGRPWMGLVRESDKGIAADALSAAQKEPGIAHRMDVALMAGPEEQPVPVTCWLCANADDNSTQLACVDLRGETNLRHSW